MKPSYLVVGILFLVGPFLQELNASVVKYYYPAARTKLILGKTNFKTHELVVHSRANGKTYYRPAQFSSNPSCTYSSVIQVVVSKPNNIPEVTHEIRISATRRWGQGNLFDDALNAHKALQNKFKKKHEEAQKAGYLVVVIDLASGKTSLETYSKRPQLNLEDDEE